MTLYKIIVKSLEDGTYLTPYTNTLYHKGDVMWLDGEKYVVITGDCLPKI